MERDDSGDRSYTPVEKQHGSRQQPYRNDKISKNTSPSSSWDSDIDQHTPSIWFSRRFAVAVVVFLCFTNTIVLQCSVNIAFVEMTTDKLITVGNTTVLRSADFSWDSATIGIISSVFLYGELLSFFASCFVNKLGGSTSCALCMTVAGLLTVLQPATLYLDYNLFLVNRFVTGCFVSSFFVSVVEIYSRWFPKKERSTLISLCYNGSNVGVTISYPVFGYVANRWGWQMVFYVTGLVSVLFALLCQVFVKNRPFQDGKIADRELKYILHETDDSLRKQVSTHPYRQIILSAPVLAVCIGKFALLWVDAIITGCLPLYVRDLTGESTDEVGLISSVPTAFEILIYPIAGTVLDWWKNNTDIALTRMHKITITAAYLSASVLFIAITFCGSFTWSMVFFVLIQIAISVVPPVIEPIIVTIAPNDSSVVAGMGMVFAVFGTIISRTLTGFMTIDNTVQEWNNCFLLVAAVLVVSTAIFVKYGSSERQSWPETSSTATKEERDYLVQK